ncbi:MAG: sulfotransferase [Actinomycetota bacterium]|nr:sulfotransferase [Actinomycetota bacterium]
MNTLFVAGPGRSGTTAFAQYMNRHPGVLVCRERYKFIPKKITPELFTFERILDYREGETNLPREYHANLLGKKEPGKVEWIGDKAPGYVKSLGALQKNNPNARFVVMHRPIEEVAESYDERSKSPDDPWLGGKDGFEMGVREWNAAMKKTREFAESASSPNVLIVSYHGFFYRNEAWIPLLSQFLGLEFDDAVRRSWRRMSLRFEERRRDKEPLDERQARLIAKNKNHAAEEWILKRIERQWEELEETSGAGAARPPSGEGGNRTKGDPSEGELRKRLRERKRRIEELESSLLEERGEARSLARQNQRLELRVRGLERLQTGRSNEPGGVARWLNIVKDGLSKLRRSR